MIQEEQVGEDQSMKDLKYHEKDFEVYSVGHRESDLLKILEWEQGWNWDDNEICILERSLSLTAK